MLSILVRMGWQCLLAVLGVLGAARGEDTVGVTMCCPEGRVLKLVQASTDTRRHFRRFSPDENFIPKCVRSRRGPKDTLAGESVIVKNGEDRVEREVTNMGTMLPSCELGLRVQLVSLNSTSSSSNSSEGNSTGGYEDRKRVRLGDYRGDACGLFGCRKGNVYVDDKPVCDDGWDDNDAQVVCRELGFKDGGYATKESYFGSVNLETQAGWDQVECSGRESSLLECRHLAHDDCGNSEGAGVVCYSSEERSGHRRYNDGYGTYASPPPPEYYPRPPPSHSNYGYNNFSSPSYGSAESEDSSLMLGMSGELVVASTWQGVEPVTYQAGEFCMAGAWEGGPGVGVGDSQAVALMCEPCTSEVICSAVRAAYDKFSGRSGEIVGDERHEGTQNMVQVGDKNNDAKLNFEEFKAMAEDYIGKVFRFLDADEDGFLDEDVSIKSLSAKLFLETLNELYLFVDLNQDDILSVDDAPPRAFRDRNDDGKISLREVFGVSLINLPAPLYRLYATLDRDKNEKLSFEEAELFIKGTLYVIDQNEDCSIDTDELIATLRKSQLPPDYQLAMKLLGDYYITLADFCIRRVIIAADADGDKKTSLAELLGMKDPEVFLAVMKTAQRMGEPHRRTSEFLVGDERYSSRDQREAVQEMWLNVLYDFVDNRKYDSVPEDFCKLGE